MADLQFDASIVPKIDPSQMASGINQIQQQFSKLKLPKEMQGKFDKVFDGATQSAEKFMAIFSSGTKTKGDLLGLEKAGKDARVHLQQLKQEVEKIDFDKLKKDYEIEVKAKGFKEIDSQIADTKKQMGDMLSGIKINDKSLNMDNLQTSMNTLIKGFGDLSQKGTEAANTLKSSFSDAIKTGDFSKVSEGFSALTEGILKFRTVAPQVKTSIEGIVKSINEGNFEKASEDLQKLQIPEGATQKAKNYIEQLQKIGQVLAQTSKVSMTQDFHDLQDALSGLEASKIEQVNTIVEKMVGDTRNAAAELIKLATAMGQATAKGEDLGRSTANFNAELDQIKNRVQYFFGLTNAVQLFRRALQDTFNTVKELDASMTETAVVTDFSVGDMWDQLPQYTAAAKEYGATIKGVYDVMTLYYQQGLDQDQAWALGTDTLKLARIAGLDYAESTDRMTNALRGFNMELNAQNAQRVDDVYSKLAAMSASNVDELSVAMTKTASIANSANMEFETTAAFLAQIIETTR